MSDQPEDLPRSGPGHPDDALEPEHEDADLSGDPIPDEPADGEFALSEVDDGEPPETDEP